MTGCGNDSPTSSRSSVQRRDTDAFVARAFDCLGVAHARFGLLEVRTHGGARHALRSRPRAEPSEAGRPRASVDAAGGGRESRSGDWRRTELASRCRPIGRRRSRIVAVAGICRNAPTPKHCAPCATYCRRLPTPGAQSGRHHEREIRLISRHAGIEKALARAAGAPCQTSLVAGARFGTFRRRVRLTQD